MKKVVTLNESDIIRIVKRILNEVDGPNKKAFDACVSTYVKPQNEDLETFYKRPEVAKTCAAIRHNINAYDNLFIDNKYINGQEKKANILMNCFYSIEENKNQKPGQVDAQGNVTEKGDDRQFGFIECVKTE